MGRRRGMYGGVLRDCIGEEVSKLDSGRVRKPI